MASKRPIDRFLFGLGCIFLGLALSGVNYCQRDYDLGSQSSLNETPTSTPTEEGTGTETPEATESAEPTVTPEVTSTPTATPENTAQAQISQNLPLIGVLKALEAASEKTDPQARASLGNDGNWLGRMKGGTRAWADADGDGYADWFEMEHSTDPDAASSVPRLQRLSKYSPRLQIQDSDLDALTNQDERRYGTNARNVDSDGDGASDGAEVLSSSDPLDASSRPQDSDGDGLSDNYERSIGSRPDRADSDLDGLRDELELAVGSDLAVLDSDADGISDGKEFALGSDPLVKD